MNRTVAALKLALRSYREFYDRIWLMMLVTTCWWLLLVTVLFAPSATLLLFKVADPRQGPWDERLTFREAVAYLWSNLVRGWKLALATVPIIALCAFNLRYYGRSDGAFALIAPIWLLCLIAGFCAFVAIFARGALVDDSAGETIRSGVRLTALRFPGILTVVLVTFAIPATVFVDILYFLAPLALLLPGLLATAMTRLVLKSEGRPIPEPNKPTEERLHEKRSDGQSLS